MRRRLRKDETECAMTVGDQVLSPLVLAANIATMGLATPATEAGTAAKETIVVGGKTVAGSGKVGQAMVKAVKALQTVKPAGLEKGASIARTIYAAKTGTKIKTVVTTAKTTKAAYDAGNDYAKAYAEDFAAQTSSEINKAIDSHFYPATAKFLKETWGRQQLAEMATANGWVIAQDAMGVVAIVDITGVSGVVNAYAKPICQDLVAFPKVAGALN